MVEIPNYRKRLSCGFKCFKHGGLRKCLRVSLRCLAWLNIKSLSVPYLFSKFLLYQKTLKMIAFSFVLGTNVLLNTLEHS